MNTLIIVNERITVSKLVESEEYGLYQDIETGEFVVWHRDQDQGYRGGYYTHDLDDALDMYHMRTSTGIYAH